MNIHTIMMNIMEGHTMGGIPNYVQRRPVRRNFAKIRVTRGSSMQPRALGSTKQTSSLVQSYSSMPGRRRRRFTTPRLPFSSSRRRTDALVGLVAWRFFGRRERRSSSAWIFSRQRSRFWSWLRDSLLTTIIPVGTWRMRTAESVVLTPCPPGPVARNASASHWRASSARLSRAKLA